MPYTIASELFHAKLRDHLIGLFSYGDSLWLQKIDHTEDQSHGFDPREFQQPFPGFGSGARDFPLTAKDGRSQRYCL